MAQLRSTGAPRTPWVLPVPAPLLQAHLPHLVGGVREPEDKRGRESGRENEHSPITRSPDRERANVQSPCFPTPGHTGTCTGLFGPSSLHSRGQQQKSPEVQVLGSAPHALEMHPSPSPWSLTSHHLLVSIPLCLWLCLSPSYFHFSVQTGRVTVPLGSSGAPRAH